MSPEVPWAGPFLPQLPPARASPPRLPAALLFKVAVVWLTLFLKTIPVLEPSSTRPAVTTKNVCRVTVTSKEVGGGRRPPTGPQSGWVKKKKQPKHTQQKTTPPKQHCKKKQKLGRGCSPLLLPSFVAPWGSARGPRAVEDAELWPPGVWGPGQVRPSLPLSLAPALHCTGLAESRGSSKVLPAGLSVSLRPSSSLSCAGKPGRLSVRGCPPSEGWKQGFPREGRKPLRSPSWFRLFHESLFKHLNVQINLKRSL